MGRSSRGDSVPFRPCGALPPPGPLGRTAPSMPRQRLTWAPPSRLAPHSSLDGANPRERPGPPRATTWIRKHSHFWDAASRASLSRREACERVGERLPMRSLRSPLAHFASTGGIWAGAHRSDGPVGLATKSLEVASEFGRSGFLGFRTSEIGARGARRSEFGTREARNFRISDFGFRSLEPELGARCSEGSTLGTLGARRSDLDLDRGRIWGLGYSPRVRVRRLPSGSSGMASRALMKAMEPWMVVVTISFSSLRSERFWESEISKVRAMVPWRQ